MKKLTLGAVQKHFWVQELSMERNQAASLVNARKRSTLGAGEPFTTMVATTRWRARRETTACGDETMMHQVV